MYDHDQYDQNINQEVRIFGGCFVGMTMVKLGKGEESTPVDFINKRRAALERYVHLLYMKNSFPFL